MPETPLRLGAVRLLVGVRLDPPEPGGLVLAPAGVQVPMAAGAFAVATIDLIVLLITLSLLDLKDEV